MCRKMRVVITMHLKINKKLPENVDKLKTIRILQEAEQNNPGKLKIMDEFYFRIKINRIIKKWMEDNLNIYSEVFFTFFLIPDNIV